MLPKNSHEGLTILLPVHHYLVEDDSTIDFPVVVRAKLDGLTDE